jgi:hypothetical protein
MDCDVVYYSIVLTYVVVDGSPFADFEERSMLSESAMIRHMEVAGIKYMPGVAYITFMCATALSRIVIHACRLSGASFCVKNRYYPIQFDRVRHKLYYFDTIIFNSSTLECFDFSVRRKLKYLKIIGKPYRKNVAMFVFSQFLDPKCNYGKSLSDDNNNVSECKRLFRIESQIFRCTMRTYQAFQNGAIFI